MSRRSGFATRNQPSLSARQIIHVVLLLSLLLGYAPAPLQAAPPEPLEPEIAEPAGIDGVSSDPEAGIPEFIEDLPVEEEPMILWTYEEIEAAGSAQDWPVELPPPPTPEIELSREEGLASPLTLAPVAEEEAIIEIGETLSGIDFAPVWDEPVDDIPELDAQAFAEEQGEVENFPGGISDAATDGTPGLYIPLIWADVADPPDSGPQRRLVPGTVEVEHVLEASVLQALVAAPEIAPSIADFAITDQSKIGDRYFVSVIGLAGAFSGADWNLLDNGAWFGLVIVEPGGDAWRGAVEGTDAFSHMLASIPNQMLSAEAKQSLDPQIRASAVQSYGFPWDSGSWMQYGVRGVHDNEFGSVTGPDWSAVDLLSDGDTGAGHAPNRLLAAASGSISYKCTPKNGGTSSAVRIDNLMYTHLQDSGNLYTGRWLAQGDEIGQMKTGSFSETCGYASQGGSWFHVHLGFPRSAPPQLGSWSLNVGDQRWYNGGESRGTGEWLQSGGGSGSCSNPNLVSPGDGETVRNRTVHLDWDAPNCSGLNGYTLHVTTGNGPEDGIISGGDTGVGGTEYDFTFPNDGTFYWHVAAWTNGQRTGWSSRRIVIDTSGGGPSTGTCDSPGADQAALFSDPYFRGACDLLGFGEYSSPSAFPNVGDNGTSSMRVGSNVRLVLYENEGFGGRSEPFEGDKDNLAGTGLGDSVVSSAKVLRRLPPPASPNLAAPASGAIFDEGQTIELSWDSAADASEYYGEARGGPAGAITFGWQGGTTASIGAPIAGITYDWSVKARNYSHESGMSETRYFTVRLGAPANLVASSPGCTRTSMTWSDGSSSEQGYRIYRNGNLVGEVGANVTTFAQSSVPAGSYTYNVYAYRGGVLSASSNSAQVTVGACAPVAKLTVTTTPANQVHTGAGPVATRFTFQETAGTAVSIRSYTYRWYSANGSVALSGAVAPITLNRNVPGGGSATWSAGVQLPGWVVQKATDRGESVVRLHFTFNGVDSAGRTVSAATYATLQLSACGDTAEPNNATANAKTISYGQTLTGVICPAGDLDLYKFSGTAGDRLRIAARQRAGSGTINPMLELLASDGRTVVAANNDRAIDQLQTDSRIAVVLPSTGLYYLRITDAARRGGVAQSYDLLLHQDTALPSVAIRPLAGGSWVHATQQLIRVNAGDRGSEVDHVQFFVLLPDGQGWKFLGSDATAADGWFFRWNTAQIAPHQGSAIYVYAIDGAGNSRGVGLYNLGLERTAPTVKATAGPVYGDAPFRDFSVSWRNGYDSGSGIASYDVQVRKGATGAWTNWLTATTLTAARYVGIVGYSYYFRARAHDRTGATSAFAGGNGDAAFTVRACPANADNYETDNSATAARSVRSDGSRYWHNFHYEGDNDWVKFYARAATTYTLRTYMEGKHADTVLTLYSTDGKTVLATNDDIAAAGGPSQIAWKASATGVYFARITHHDPYGHGCTTAYHIGVTATPATSSLPATAGGNMADNVVDSELAPPGDFAPPQENARDGTE